MKINYVLLDVYKDLNPLNSGRLQDPLLFVEIPEIYNETHHYRLYRFTANEEAVAGYAQDYQWVIGAYVQNQLMPLTNQDGSLIKANKREDAEKSFRAVIEILKKQNLGLASVTRFQAVPI